MDEKAGRDEEPDFPDYTGLQFTHMPSQPQIDLDASQSSSDEPTSESVTTDTTRSDSPLPTPTVVDDTAVKQEPKQHVDYLSHDWREEDIWSSWRHIVSQRGVYGQRSRLENASWRTWAKAKYHLRTVSPETLNWLKESDVTWLYGPLKPAESHPVTSGGQYSEPYNRLSKSNSFCVKKPILKKRSMSEVMLQKSLSTSSLVKQAAAAVQAHPLRRSASQRSVPDLPSASSLQYQSETPSRDPTLDYFTSRSTSDTTTPSAACECKHDRHIRFDDKVEQCIAVECKEGEEAEESDSEDEGLHHRHGGTESESDSDEGLIMLRKKRRPGVKRKGSGDSRKRASSSNGQAGRKMVETLPATTLKYKTESPEDSKHQSHHTFGFRNWSLGGSGGGDAADDLLAPPTSTTSNGSSSNRLSPSPSQETLRPTRPARNFLLPTSSTSSSPSSSSEDDTTASEFDAGGPTSSWTFGASNTKSSLGSASASSDEEEVDMSSSRWHRRRDSAASKRPARGGSSRAGNGTPAPPNRRTGTNSTSSPPSSSSASASQSPYPSISSQQSSGSNNGFSGADGTGELRRTASGMMMPYSSEEEEEDLMAVGLFGRVSETINTARDIAHVIWNVGWRGAE